MSELRDLQAVTWTLVEMQVHPSALLWPAMTLFSTIYRIPYSLINKPMAIAVQDGGGRATDYNGSLLEILTIVLASVSFLVVSVRCFARYRLSRALEITDILLPSALALLVSQSTCVRISLSSGLGRHFTSLQADQISQFEKLIYASNLLFQVVLSLTQVVVVLLIKSVEPPRPVRVGCNVLLGIIVVYSTLVLAILAFQCSLPTPWEVSPNRCVDRQTFLTSFLIASIAIDTITLILLVVMMCMASTSREKKIFVCALFGTRLALPLVTAPQILHLQTIIVSKDPTWDLVPFQQWVQIVINLSVITACLPSLGRVIWEMWAFGSGIRSTKSPQDSESRDFGHELGLEQAPPQYQEKHYIEAPSSVYADEKDDWCNDILFKVREIGSGDSLQAVVGQSQALPLIPQRITPMHSRTGRHNRRYRRPTSRFLSPVIERSPYIEGLTPPLATQHWGDHPLPQLPERKGPPSYAASSLYDDDRSEMDFSEVDIDSYYLGNTHTGRPYYPSHTEIVLQSMIEDLEKENDGVDPAKRWEYGWI